MTDRSVVRRAPGVLGSLLGWLAARLGAAAAARVRVGRLTVVLPDGSWHVFGATASEPRAEIHVHDTRALVRMLLHGETGAGEAYTDGLWTSPDLPALLRWAALNREIPCDLSSP